MTELAPTLDYTADAACAEEVLLLPQGADIARFPSEARPGDLLMTATSEIYDSNEYMMMPQFLNEAVRLSAQTRNSLLMEYCESYFALEGLEMPDTSEIDSPAHLKWLDTDIEGADQLTPHELLKRKIDRTVEQIKGTEEGSQYICYVAVPALDEEEDIPVLIKSLKRQTTEMPIVFLVADNNSTDRTAFITTEAGGNVIAAPEPGVGAARQTALSHVLDDISIDPSRVIIIQTDADCEAEPDYVTSVIEELDANPDIQIGVGPSVYRVPLESGEVLEISSGKDYGSILGTTGLRGYFEALGRDARDYLIEPPFRYLVGPNTAYRASLFFEHDLHYPVDGRWETLDLSVKVQQRIPSSKAIQYVPGQCMQVSPRAFLAAGESCLTDDRLEELRANGFVSMFKSGGVNRTPLDTMRETLREVESQVYGLEPGQEVIAVINADDPRASQGNSVPALHSASKEPIAGKVALIR